MLLLLFFYDTKSSISVHCDQRGQEYHEIDKSQRLLSAIVCFSSQNRKLFQVVFLFKSFKYLNFISEIFFQ